MTVHFLAGKENAAKNNDKGLRKCTGAHLLDTQCWWIPQCKPDSARVKCILGYSVWIATLLFNETITASSD